MTTRVLPPANDAHVMSANGWIPAAHPGGQVGATAARPTSSLGNGTAPARGALFLDTTVGAVIVWDGATWRNPATGASV